MTAVATRRAELSYAHEATRLDRLVAVLPVLSAYLLLAAFYAWHARSHGTPWLFSDELEYTQLSRAIAETGEAARRGEVRQYESLYSYLLAPVWWISDVQVAYSTAKYLGVFVMTTAIFPAYGLARMLVPRSYALFAAVAATTIPALAYSRLLITEILAYPYAALALFVMAKTLATGSRFWLAGTLLVLLPAAHVRDQLVILWPVFLLAAVIALALSDRARHYYARAGWGGLELTAALAVAAALAGAGHELAKKGSWQYYVATTLPDRMEKFEQWAAGAFVIGIGVLPALAALTALARPEDLRFPAYRAWAALFASAAAAFAAYTSVKATYLSTVFADVVAERNLMYLSPLVFAGTALMLHRPRVRVPVLVAAGMLLAYLITATPFQLDHYPYFDAPGLAILAEGNRELSLDDAETLRRLLWILAGSGALLAGASALRRRRALLQPVLGTVAVLIVAWTFTGLNAFGQGINHLSNRLAGSIPQPPDWIDEQTGDRETLYLGQGIADPNAAMLTEFWNRSIDHVGSLDGTAPGPGPTVTPVPWKQDGSVLDDPGVEYVATDSYGVDVFGELVLQTGLWRLIRIDGPLRLRSSITGVYSDGWTGAGAAYNRFGSGERGIVTVNLSRLGWTGEDKAARVTVRIGRLVPAPERVIRDPCLGGTCVSPQPRIDRLIAERTWVAHSSTQETIRVPVATPFRVEVQVDPTFSPRDYGQSDGRQLGVQIAFAFDLLR